MYLSIYIYTFFNSGKKKKKKKKGNQFGGQEPHTPEQIISSMHAKFGVTFPILDKVKVNGPEESPLFTFSPFTPPPFPFLGPST